MPAKKKPPRRHQPRKRWRRRKRQPARKNTRAGSPQKGGAVAVLPHVNFNPGGEFIFSSRFFCRKTSRRGHANRLGSLRDSTSGSGDRKRPRPPVSCFARTSEIAHRQRLDRARHQARARCALAGSDHGNAAEAFSRPRPLRRGRHRRQPVERSSMDRRSDRWHGELLLRHPAFLHFHRAAERGEIIVGVIYDPMRDELWRPKKGRRRC